MLAEELVMQMKVKVLYAIKGLNIDCTNSLIIKNISPNINNVILRLPTEEEKNRDPSLFNVVICVANGNYSLKPEIEKIFRSISERCVPEGISSDFDTTEYIDSNGSIKPGYILPLSCLPSSFQDFCKDIIIQLSEVIKKIVRLVRWRYNLRGGHNPFRELHFVWALDESKWHRFPHSIVLDVEQYQQLKVTEDVSKEVQEIFDAGVTEPLGQELFREAWEQIYRNRRSALVVGIAAAETGFKECLAKLEPSVDWFLKEIQSPPLEKMLRDYWPTLPKLPVVKGKKIIIPSALITTLKKGITIRNKIVHGRQTKLSHDTLVEILSAIKDLLLLFDYAVGRKWSEFHAGNLVQTLVFGHPEKVINEAKIKFKPLIMTEKI